MIFFSSTSLAAKWCEAGFRYLAALLFSGFGPDQPSYGVIHLVAEKGFHVSMFLVLAVLLWKAIPAGRWKVATVILLGAFVGSCSEFLQRFFPGRDPAIRDVLINVCGTALGVGLVLAFTKRNADTSGEPSGTEGEAAFANKG